MHIIREESTHQKLFLERLVLDVVELDEVARLATKRGVVGPAAADADGAADAKKGSPF